jgi:hypothetical protein
MKKNLLIAVISAVFLMSCDGLLWDGIDSSTGDLSITIENPSNSTSTSSGSRTLSPSGGYLYIELAKIDDIDGYNDAYNNGDLAQTGDGSWVETSWGGYAILTFTIYSDDPVLATFKNIPRGDDIRARVIEDYSESAFIEGIEGLYGYDGDPECYTYDSSAPDIFTPIDGYSTSMDQMWVTVTSSELSSGVILFQLISYGV